MTTIGVPEENSFAERLVRTIKEQEVDLSDYRDIADACSNIGHFLEDVYQTKRIHSALGFVDSFVRVRFLCYDRLPKLFGCCVLLRGEH